MKWGWKKEKVLIDATSGNRRFEEKVKSGTMGITEGILVDDACVGRRDVVDICQFSFTRESDDFHWRQNIRLH